MGFKAMRSALLSAVLMSLAAADEEIASPVACAIAGTLFGTIFVIMMLYYLFNWPDPDIRRYSYEVVSSTISIFCAVLLFQSFAGTLEKLTDGKPLWATITAAFLHRLFWHSVLQFSLAYITKSILHPEAVRAKIITEGGGEDMNKIEMNAKCWGVLLAHMTGFASIAAWGSVQQSPWFRQNWYYSWLVVPAALITNIPILKFTDWVRDKIASAGDGESDCLEKMWDEEVEEAENDITALALSFLTVQSIKYLICGSLPNVEGEEKPDLTFGHKDRDYLFLYLFGTLCIPVFCFFVVKLKALEEGEEEGEEKKPKKNKEQIEEEKKEAEEKAEANEKKARYYDQIVATFVMNMAWSYFYSTKWALGSVPGWGGNTTLLCLTEAVVVSVVCFTFIFLLDKAADAEWTGDAADECIKSVIMAIGILVGFSWEQCFDAAVAALASNTSYPNAAKQLLAIACALLVVPAWKVYMLPVIVHEGWRFGFIASFAAQYIDANDEDSMKHYLDQIKELTTGHKAHVGNPELKKQIKDLLLHELTVLEGDEDDLPYHKMPDH